MSPESKELFRKAILKSLNNYAGRMGFGVMPIGSTLAVFGFSPANFKGDVKAYHSAIADELDYLVRNGLAVEVVKTISKDNRAWRITDATDGEKSGVQFLDENP